MGTNSAILEAQIGERFFPNSNIPHPLAPNAAPSALCPFFVIFLYRHKRQKSKSATNLGRPLSSFSWMGRLIANLLQVSSYPCFHSVSDMLFPPGPILSFISFSISFLMAVYVHTQLRLSFSCFGYKPLCHESVSITNYHTIIPS